MIYFFEKYQWILSILLQIMPDHENTNLYNAVES